MNIKKIFYTGYIIILLLCIRYGFRQLGAVGEVRDLYAEVENFYFQGIGWSSVLIPVALLGILGIVFAYSVLREKKISKLFYKIYFGVAVVGIMGSILLNQKILKEASYFQMELTSKAIEINMKDLQAFAQNKEGKMIYIGRDDCKSCYYLEPQLNRMIVEKDVHIYYYNTGNDRIERKEEMLETLDRYNIKTVPALIICNGTDYNVFQGEECYKVVE